MTTPTTTPGSVRAASASNAEQVHEVVRARYGSIARSGCGCGSPAGDRDPGAGAAPGCCGPTAVEQEPATGGVGCCGSAETRGAAGGLPGYAAGDLAHVPEGANLGLGCGNPIAEAAPRRGETVLDLGSGAGIDCFIAAELVGPEGRVIGVDMTPEMLARARANARMRSDRHPGGYANVEFRLGQIEALPLADASVDLVISNCVVNLSPDKPRVWREVHRVLRPGGRVIVSDVVATTELPPEARSDLSLLAGCIAGAATIPEVESDLRAAGFTGISVAPKDGSRELIRTWAPGRRLEDFVVSATIRAVKPGA